MISRSWISPQRSTIYPTTSPRFLPELVESLPFNSKKIAGADVAGYATDTGNPSQDDDKERKRRWSASTFLSRETIGLISSRKEEPDWMLEFRLKAYEEFLKTEEPPRPDDDQFPAIDFVDMFTDLEKKANLLDCSGLDKDDVYAYYRSEAFDARRTAIDLGVIMCPISEAIRKYPDLVRHYLGRVVPPEDNFYAALNSAVFKDGTFVYVPKDVKLPVHLSSPLRVRSTTRRRRRETTFRRTLVVADTGSRVRYFEGPSAHGAFQPPSSTDVRLNAGVVELYCHECAEIEYFSLQDWCCRKPTGSTKTFSSNVFSFDTEKGICEGAESKICWSHVETGTVELLFGKIPEDVHPDMIVDWGDNC